MRQRAGWNRLTRPWRQDVCRHSFATATTPPCTATCTNCSSRWATGTPPCCAPVTWLYPPLAPPNVFGDSHHLVARDLSPALRARRTAGQISLTPPCTDAPPRKQKKLLNLSVQELRLSPLPRRSPRRGVDGWRLSTPGGSVRTVGLGVAAQLRRRVAGPGLP